MDKQTLTAAWTPYTHPSSWVAEAYQLGNISILRRTGEGIYYLIGLFDGDVRPFQSLELAQSEGVKIMTAHLATSFKDQEIDPLDGDDSQGEAGPDVQVINQGSIVLVKPLTTAAEAWIDDNVQDDAQWFGKALVVEPRYIAYLVEGMVAGGLQFTGRSV